MKRNSGQRYTFGFMDSLLAEVAGVHQAALHLDVEAIAKAYESIQPIAARLGIEAPTPRLAGLSYNHVSTLGANVTISYEAQEPFVTPCIRCPQDIDRLHEPDDYLTAGILPHRLEMLARLKQRCPTANVGIGHDYQGPVTSAALLMGQDFFMLPHDDPARAHRLLGFCVKSALNYSRALRLHQGRPIGPNHAGMCDDFGGMFGPGMFREFVLPYWEGMYSGQMATSRGLHCEMLREEHMPFLKQLRINEYDPSVDQYLPPEVLKRSCPVPYTLRMWPSEVLAHSAKELVEMYRHRASFRPIAISFHLDSLANESKIAALLEVARELAGPSVE